LEFSPGFRVIDYFSDYISFNVCIKDKDDTSHTHQLNKMVLKSTSSSSVAIIASDVSIKNNVTTSIAHMHTYNKPLTKMIHHIVLVTSTEVELFAIRCGINQAMNLNSIAKIIVVTDVKTVDGGLHSFLFSLFLFFVSFIFYFLFLEQLGLGLSVTLSHQSQIDGVVTRLITGLGRMK